LDAPLVVLHGNNAQGKTNVLEAIWTLANLQSFRESKAGRLIREGAQEARIGALVEGQSGRRAMAWKRSGAQRELKVDGAPVGPKDWFGLVRAVLFCPDHAALVRGEPALRRNYIDRAIFTAEAAHLDLVLEYRRAAAQKAALLRRGGDRVQLSVWNERLAQLGAALSLRRRRMVGELSAVVQAEHEAIAGEGARLRLRWRGAGEEAPDEAALALALLELLQRAEAEELRRGQLLVGPHRDDLELELDGRSARAFASQGQARSLVLALKLAELQAARSRGGDPPLLLVDDLTSELDPTRMRRFIVRILELENQIWITTTDPRWLGRDSQPRASFWRVAGGSVAPGLGPG
jgi:DNA replication and repair protein RecF